MNYRITKHTDRLYQIVLNPPMDGFTDFICSWIYRGKKTFLTDTGPSVTAGDVLAALTDIGLETIDYILLTHIHIDHAGGIGEISAAFPQAPIVCHEIARPHLINPEKLWQGTVKTLGETGRAYGKITPVPEDRLIDARNFSSKTMTPILTPGHAPHHISFMADDGTLLAGEAGGVLIDFDAVSPYLRPATPPKFFMETSMASLDLLIDQQPRYICYGHAAMKDDAVNRLKAHKQQLQFWKDTISQEMRSGKGDRLIPGCIDRLVRSDPLMQGLSFAPEPVLQREKFFIRNSIKGFIGYLDRTS